MKKVLKIAGWFILSLVALVVIIITVAVWYLTPQKLTPIVEREATDLIDGRVEVSRVELTFWKSFPRLELDVDSLRVISNTMHTVDDSLKAELPVYTDSLLSVDYIHGGINLLSLLKGRIELYNLTIKRPCVNIVVGRNGADNFNIMKPGVEESDSVKSTGALPDIAFDSFRITDAGPLTFTSIPDSTFVTASLSNIEVTGSNQPVYKLEIAGNASSPILDNFKLSPLTLGLDGRIIWNLGRPAAIAVDNLAISINELAATVDAEVDATDSMTINKLNIDINSLDINDIVKHLPDESLKMFASLNTDMKLKASAKLQKPYTLGDSLKVPSVNMSIDIEPCSFYLGNIHMDNVNFVAEAAIDGDNPDNSEVMIQRLLLHGKALDIDVSGKVTGPLDNLYIDGHLATALRIQRLPRELMAKLPIELRGYLEANTVLRFHINDFTAKGFHNIYADGRVTLRDFDLLSRDSLVKATATRADLDFGTRRTVKGTETRVDSMLTLSLKIDTTAVELPGLKIQGSELTAALGSENRNESSDTTKINPFGGVIRFKSLTLDQPQDTFTVRLRDVDARAILTRYNGIERAPELKFDLGARRIGTRMPDFALAISQPEISINAHLIPRNSSPSDSLRRQRRAANRLRHAVDSLNHDEVIDWNVSNDLKTLLRRWDVDGSLRSNRAFIFTRHFPLRQRAANIDLHFNTDTVRLNSLDYNIGNTRLKVKGDISNIERALAGRSGRAKLKIDFDVSAPFIDINELATTTFYESSGEAGPDPDYDEETIYAASSATTDTTAPRAVLIPRNIQANLAVNADSILYSDLLMHSFSGDVLVDNSAINLRDFHASTEIGTASLSALYWAPDTAHMQFGMGMKLNRFQIDRVLSLIPAVDSLLPALSGFAGIINADLAATADITPTMDFDLASFKGALKLDGDSLVLLDADTFKMLAKWLIFKNKKRNMIDHMNVEIVVDNSQVEIFPFIFDIDRYKLGVMGRNDLDMNLDYHVSVLKSPLPFKFGINIKGNLDDPKIRLGGAKIKPGHANAYAIADTTRISLLGQIEEVFRRGSMSRESMGLKRAPKLNTDALGDTILTANDSLLMRREGFLPPDTNDIQAPEPTKKRRFPWTKK